MRRGAIAVWLLPRDLLLAMQGAAVRPLPQDHFSNKRTESQARPNTLA